MNTKNAIKTRLLKQIEQAQQEIKKLDEIPGFEKIEIGDIGYFFTEKQFDFDHLKREQIIDVIKALGGTWEKTPSSEGATINYSQTINGYFIRMWEGEPPPNCKIIEYLEEIPAQPARTVTKRKLQCV
jgi:hypothetical protein